MSAVAHEVIGTGLLVRGDDADAVTLATVVQIVAGALERRFLRASLAGGGAVLLTDALDAVALTRARERGAPVCQLVRRDGHVLAVGDDGVVLDDVTDTSRHDGLLAALPLSTVVVTRPPREALFVVDVADHSVPGARAIAARLAAHLLVLGRSEARTTTLITEDGRERPALRVVQPPWWLLSRVIDGDEPGVRALRAVNVAEIGPERDTVIDPIPAPLYVELGVRHPLEGVLATALATRHEVGLLWDSGRLERVVGLAEVALGDAVTPTLPAVTVTTKTVAPTEHFSIPLRLAKDGSEDATEPELFVVPANELSRLVTFAEAAAPGELDRILLTRLADDDGGAGRAVYVVRELVRPGASRLGARLMSVLGRSGFVEVPGTTGLYVPRGARLSPTLAPKALRALCGLRAGESGADDSGAAAVIVDEDTDGLKATALVTLDSAPLSQLSTFALTDRRTVYDALLEDAALTFPAVQLARPQGMQAEPAPRPRREPPPRAAPRPPVAPVVVTPTHAPRVELQDDTREARAREAELEQKALRAPEDADAWRELGRAKIALSRDDATETSAVALFLGARIEPAELARLVARDELGQEPAARLLELCTVEQLTQARALRLVIEVLRLTDPPRAGRAHALEGDLLEAATRALLRDTVPLPRRLQWVGLRAIATYLNDPIALTRAKEAVLGAINERGLSETVDVPRFVRTALAFASDDTKHRDLATSRVEQQAILERGLALLVGDTSQMSDSRAALLKAIFCQGFARTGGPAQQHLDAIELERVVHDAPVQALLQLYGARVSFTLLRASSESLTDADQAEWRADALRVLATVVRPEDRRVAEWLAKRSAWLRHDEPKDTSVGLRPSLRRVVDAAVQGQAEGRRVDIVAALSAARAVHGCYDFEITAAAERLLSLAAATGRDDAIAGAAHEAMNAAQSVRIAAHRARLLGAVVRAASLVDDNELIERCLEGVASIASDKSVPSVSNLLFAIRPAILALRKVGATADAARFLAAFAPMTERRETGPLSAALAQGYLQLGDGATAQLMLERAQVPVWHPGTPHVDRFEAGMAVVSALSSWPIAERAALLLTFCERLERFTDMFTTRTYYPTHQLLIAERIVDAIADDRTARSDALQGFLDADEARLRRRVVADWRVRV